MDRLAQTARSGVGLFGIVGTHVQVFRWAQGSDPLPGTGIECGASALLSSSPAGLLLLSSLGVAQASKMLWRLNAEAAPADRFNLAETNEAVARFAQEGHATGASGFAPATRMTAILLPETLGERRLALGVVYPDHAAIDPDALLATLDHGAQSGFADGELVSAPFVRSMMAM